MQKLEYLEEYRDYKMPVWEWVNLFKYECKPYAKWVDFPSYDWEDEITFECFVSEWNQLCNRMESGQYGGSEDSVEGWNDTYSRFWNGASTIFGLFIFGSFVVFVLALIGLGVYFALGGK